jgi:hypothetical protein
MLHFNIQDLIIVLQSNLQLAIRTVHIPLDFEIMKSIAQTYVCAS